MSKFGLVISGPSVNPMEHLITTVFDFVQCRKTILQLDYQERKWPGPSKVELKEEMQRRSVLGKEQTHAL